MFKRKLFWATSAILLVAILTVFVTWGGFFKKEAVKHPSKTNTETSFVLTAQPLLGNADAPVTVTVFSDYNCSYCAKWENSILPLLKSNVVQSGAANIRFVNQPVLGEMSDYAAMAAELVHDQKPEAFLAFHHDVLAHQTDISLDWLAECVTRYVPSVTLTQAKEKILDQTYKEAALADQNYAKEKQVSRVPTILVGEVKMEDGFDVTAIQTAIESLQKSHD